ncbi:MAG: 4'-phosphopantetheinyl transferase superfamily protein [Propionibacteriaceae bacterium]|nr:4'-phosphopantetheinyl transferase superfamily protein [Propionibacteriaceae bacterium]
MTRAEAHLDQKPYGQVEVVYARVSPQWQPGPAAWSPRLQDLSAKLPADRRRSLAADKLLDQLCQDWQAGSHTYSSSGQPVAPAACLSASHDGDWVVAAIAGSGLGVDVVSCDQPTGWIEPFLCPCERRDLPRGDPGPALLTAWGVREAALKRLGCGLFLDPRSVMVLRSDRQVVADRSSGGFRFSTRVWEVAVPARVWQRGIVRAARGRPTHRLGLPRSHRSVWMTVDVITGSYDRQFVFALATTAHQIRVSMVDLSQPVRITGEASTCRLLRCDGSRGSEPDGGVSGPGPASASPHQSGPRGQGLRGLQSLPGVPGRRQSQDGRRIDG